jgi:hypothetical protein
LFPPSVGYSNLFVAHLETYTPVVLEWEGGYAWHDARAAWAPWIIESSAAERVISRVKLNLPHDDLHPAHVPYSLIPTADPSYVKIVPKSAPIPPIRGLHLLWVEQQKPELPTAIQERRVAGGMF